MTRFARAGKRKFFEASSWKDLSEGVCDSSVQSRSTEKEHKSSSDKESLYKKKKNSPCVEKEKEIKVDPKRQKKIEARKLRRKKRKCCFVCRKPGHQASDCPNKDDMHIGTCFKCGSADHTTRNCKSTTSDQTKGPFPFAKCFICQEMGHLAKSCPENPRGLYPQGGGCKICGSVEHLKRDCPQLRRNKNNKGITVEAVTLSKFDGSASSSADAQDNDEEGKTRKTEKPRKRKQKIVRF